MSTPDARTAIEKLRAGAQAVRNYKLAGLCRDALAGDAAAVQRVTAILAGAGDPAAATPEPIAAALYTVDAAGAELDRARDAGDDTGPARTAYEAAYAALGAAYAAWQEDPR